MGWVSPPIAVPVPIAVMVPLLRKTGFTLLPTVEEEAVSTPSSTYTG
jgi:hypothetical protein